MCKFIAVTNRKLCSSGDFLGQIEKLAKNGVDQIVLREKDLSELEYKNLAKEVQMVCSGYQVLLLAHQYISVAKELEFEGIHLPADVAMKNRENFKEFLTVGVSTHSIEQIQVGQRCHASYAFFGHVFETDCKKGLKPRGLAMLQDICSQTTLPVYGIGGISMENVTEVFKAGAKGACVMSWGMNASETEIKQMAAICHGYH